MRTFQIYLLLFAFILVGWYVLFSGPKEKAEKVPESETITTFVGDKKVTIDTTTIVTLRNVYSNLNNEIPFCLHGFSTDSTVHITDISIPDVKSSTDTSAYYRLQSCASPDYIGVIHNHPTVSCVPSNADWFRWKWDVKKNGAKVDVIACTWAGSVGFSATTDTAVSQ